MRLKQSVSRLLAVTQLIIVVVSLSSCNSSKQVELVDMQNAYSDSLKIEVSECGEPVQFVDTIPPLEIIDPIEIQASFPGGERALKKYIMDNLKYPLGGDVCVSGKVIVRFTVEADGYITNVEVMRGINKLLDAEAVRLIESMPKWEPAYIFDDGMKKSVRSKFLIPVSFGLQATSD
ncbi:MAG: energy transducer TonB [Bacteroidales bacterium]